MNPVKKILIVLLLSFSPLSFAATSPAEIIKDTTERLIAEFTAQRDTFKQDPQRLYKRVDEIAAPHFDFDRISSWVLGKNWRAASDEQKTNFKKEFRSFLIRTYAGAINEYTGEITGQEITFLPFKADPEADDVTVKTEVQPPNGPAIPINYSMLLKDDAWKVYDVTVEGTSLVTNYRLSFAQEIRQNGLDALIAQLADRNAQELVPGGE